MTVAAQTCASTRVANRNFSKHSEDDKSTFGFSQTRSTATPKGMFLPSLNLYELPLMRPPASDGDRLLVARRERLQYAHAPLPCTRRIAWLRRLGPCSHFR